MEIGWDKINSLITGKATVEEKLQISQWANQKKSRQKFLKDAVEFYSKEDEIDVSFEDVQKGWSRINPRAKLRRRIYKYSASVAAAAAVIVFTILSYNQLFPTRDTLPAIMPGQERAKLILADGRDINLDTKARSLPGNLSVIQKADDKKATLIIDIKGRASAQIEEYNEIVVPRYAEYQINLEDGTKVWLNSETKLKFPVVFGDKQRVVYVEGEAYFQVAHNANRPFIVNIDENTKVKVLGTEFNIRTYEGNTSQSTLISGSIEFIHNGVTTKVNPGESCILEKSTGEVTLNQADIMRTIAWKNGEFVFRNETLESIITELSRWYKVDVVFENEEIKKERFYLYFDRTVGFEEIIYKMHKTGKIKYRYQNKKIVIS
jgi:ferric-dicitrate binding protein FerR (iron transport regulator)